jgi:2'-hydroxyisoflavone reductase
MIRMAETRAFGTYNATGPATPLSIAEMLYGMKSVTTSGAQFTWVPADVLREQKVNGWSNMPVWIGDSPEMAGFARRNIAKALAKGLTFRPLAVTAKDTLEWHKTRPDAEKKRLEDATRVGLTAAREAEVLKVWAERLK